MNKNVANGLPRLLIAFAFSILAILAMSYPVGAQQNAMPKPAPTKPADFNVSFVGDAILVTPMMVHQNDPRFMGIVNALHKADASAINFEGTFAGDNSYPIADSGGTWIHTDPHRLKDLQGMGLNIFSTANNHSLDYGIQGLLDTIRTFKEADATYAGIGMNLGEARAPAYLTTPHGRLAMVSSATTFSYEAPAGETRPDMRGRPGISALRHHTVYHVSGSTFDTLVKMKQDLSGQPAPAGAPAASKTLTIAADNGPITFEKSEEPSVETTPDARDLGEIVREIKDAKEMSDYVVDFTHAHEQAPGNLETPAQFVVTYAHAAIDAGADVFTASGPHVLRGIEVYKGKVIFYSLGNFIFENDLNTPQPSDLYRTMNLGNDILPAEMFDVRSDHDKKEWPADFRMWESVIANVTFHDGHPAVVTLTPIMLGYGETRPNRGIPKLADAVTAARILDRLQKISQPFGTKIAVSNGIGTIMIDNK